MMNMDKKKTLLLLKTARGQLDGIVRMIEDRRYCMDVSNQMTATEALIRKSQVLILKQYLSHCLPALSDAENHDEKMSEVMKVFNENLETADKLLK